MKEDEHKELLRFSESQRAYALKMLNTYFDYSELKKLLEEFLSVVVTDNYPTPSSLRSTLRALHDFFLNLAKFSPDVKQMTWNNFCNQMQEVEGSNKYVRGKIRALFIDFYEYVEKHTESKDVRDQIYAFSHLRLRKEMPIYKISKLTKEEMEQINSELFNVFEREVRTFFPLASQPEHIYQTSILQTAEPYIVNIYVRTNNLFLRNLLMQFVEYFKTAYRGIENVVSTFQHRLFQYYFETSIEETGISVNELKSFNFELYVRQYGFFQDIRRKYEAIGIVDKQGFLLTVLFQFYLFVNQLYREGSGNDLYPKAMLLNKFLINALLEGYVPVYRNTYEPVPDFDKWILLHDTNNQRAAYGVNNNYIDFSLVENEIFREELKRYLWIREGGDNTVKHEATVLIDFLNTANQYHAKSKNLLSIQSKNDNGYFNSDFLLKYQAAMQLRRTSKGEYLSDGTFNGEINPIRMYLRYYQTKYNISNIAFSQLKYRRIEYDGGNPMTPNDFQVIQEAFRENVEVDSDGELMFIIFQLASTTKLRIGEILSLERDCIEPMNQTLSASEVTYYSKTSYGEKVTEILLKEDIELIQRARAITEKLVEEAPKEYKKYIFLVRHGIHSDIVEPIKARYSECFRKITRSLSARGMLAKDYRAYDTRDTFIDTTWQAVEDGQINTLEVSTITGNTASVASKHYRAQQIMRYVEAVYMITIGDVNIDGEIVKDEKQIQELPQVEQGAGACKSDICVKLEVETEDSEYKCLTCKKFVTSIERISIFEARLSMYKQEKLETDSSVIKQYYQGLIELYGAFLAEMLKKEAEVISS